MININNNYHFLCTGLRLSSGLLAILLSIGQAGANEFESSELQVRLNPRTPQQIAAFYEGRGFQPAMIDLLKKQCFITVGIKNKSQTIIWHDLPGWRFSNNGKPVSRLDRSHWKQVWQAMNIPLAHQSTFRWTLLPEQLDFRPGEAEAGNIILPRTGQPIDIEARFFTTADRAGQPILVKFNNITCVNDP